jgi:hypothetical protein
MSHRTNHIDREALWVSLSSLHHATNDPQLIAETMETVISLLCTRGEYMRGWNNACETMSEAMSAKGLNAASVMAEEMHVSEASMSWLGAFVTEAEKAALAPRQRDQQRG